MIEAFSNLVTRLGLAPWALGLILAGVVFLVWCYWLGGDDDEDEAVEG